MDERAKKLLEGAGYTTEDEPRINIIVHRLVAGRFIECRKAISLTEWQSQATPGLVADPLITDALAAVGWRKP